MANAIQKPILPISLVVENRTCLVVGGGKIATRKVNSLLDAHASVIVISPQITNEINELVTVGRITYYKRVFSEKDIDGSFLVYAATDDRELNTKIVAQCRVQRVLSCAVDNGWKESDFLTPAIIRHDELTIAVTTGGQSCRRSRLVKESLGKIVKQIDNAELFIIGLSHEQLDTKDRQTLHLSKEKNDSVGKMISAVLGIQEFVIINTCNRVELHGVGALTDSTLNLLLKILDFDKLSHDSYYVKIGIEAFYHAVGLAAGLHSQLIGEYHIVSQIKNAFETGEQKLWCSGIMKEWLSATLHLSKIVRNSNLESLKSVDVDDVVVEYIRKCCGDTRQKQLLIVGTGQIGSALLKKISKENQFREINVLYRTRAPHKDEHSKHIRYFSLESLREILPKCDIVISALSSDSPIIVASDRDCITNETLLIDLGMPLNIDPLITDDKKGQLINLDYLKQWHKTKHINTAELISLCKEKIDTKREFYDKLVYSFKGRHSQ